MQNREVQNPKTKPGLDDSWVRGYSISLVFLLGGNFSGWFLGQVKLVIISICLIQMVGCSFWVKKPRFGCFQNGSWHCGNRVVMFCWFGAKKVKTKVQCQKQGLA